MHTQFLIVGQGLAGTLLAWELYQRQVSFKIISSNNQPSSSFIAGGLIYPFSSRKPTPIQKHHLFYPQMTHTLYEIENHLQQQFYYSIPSVKIIKNEELILWQKEYPHSIPVSLHQPQEIEGITNCHYFASIGASGYVNLPLFLNSMQEFLKKNNHLIETGFDYNELQISEERIQYKEIEANQIIFCEGPYILNNPWFQDCGMSLNKGEIIDIIAPDLPENQIIKSDIFILPIGHHRFRVGATYSHDEINFKPTLVNRQIIIEKLNRTITTPYTIVEHQAGIRPATRDRKPILGHHPIHKNLWVFNGLGSRGVLQGPYWSKILCQALVEQVWIPDEVNVLRYYK